MINSSGSFVKRPTATTRFIFFLFVRNVVVGFTLDTAGRTVTSQKVLAPVTTFGNAHHRDSLRKKSKSNIPKPSSVADVRPHKGDSSSGEKPSSNIWVGVPFRAQGREGLWPFLFFFFFGLRWTQARGRKGEESESPRNFIFCSLSWRYKNCWLLWLLLVSVEVKKVITLSSPSHMTG